MIGRLVGAFAVGVVGTGAVAAWYVNVCFIKHIYIIIEI